VVTTVIAREMVGFIWAIAASRSRFSIDRPACVPMALGMGSPHPDAAASGETGAVSEAPQDGDPDQRSGA
jgi:hypothetical protein